MPETLSDFAGLNDLTVHAKVKPGTRVDVGALFDDALRFFADHGVTVEWHEVFHRSPGGSVPLITGPPA